LLCTSSKSWVAQMMLFSLFLISSAVSLSAGND
jgi:hypothetical protein